MPTAAASEGGFGKYGRGIAGDVESPSLLPLLLLLLLLVLVLKRAYLGRPQSQKVTFGNSC